MVCGISVLSAAKFETQTPLNLISLFQEFFFLEVIFLIVRADSHLICSPADVSVFVDLALDLVLLMCELVFIQKYFS